MKRIDRKYLFRIGQGTKAIVILPRKDGKVVTINEWEKLHKMMGSEYTVIVIDIPEYLYQNNDYKVETTDEMAEVLHLILQKENLYDVQLFIGVSLGGMILQKYLYKYSSVPAIFISTIISQNSKISAVFQSWKNSLTLLGEEAFNISLFSWVARDSSFVKLKEKTKEFSYEKELISLTAILNHEFKQNISISSERTLLLFGKDSPLINVEEALPFMDYFDNLFIHPVGNSGMRVLEDNPIDSCNAVKEFIKGNT
ncbi:alpha/beta fold hydrolase [Streptococcus mutans]|uniref:alpha/beta fold hydrolase n=1 Tax=Streptococcus mutans TaxID=1309 RepID=UPI00066CC98D|nr:hypothetical protein [Streptococcus mutans]MCY7115585.1 alpha/beta hydrolase [Streptococcus mutans]QIQ94526.1 alpha/beta hydrolase [Streptococcus mutans]QIR00764.1 alpha/beta hydrolase [Streptococcus mutans]QIR02415.1 alpha/beta hydrolase [Streptococcus mutans]QIR04545.1 alpha/beta hydrolase [Streptococcus mutans]